MPASTDRGDVIHLAGFHRLSPALRDGAPALVAPGETAARCGWAEFFGALSARRAAVAWSVGGDAASVRIVPGGEAGRDPPHRASLGRALAQAGEFLRAWRRA
ncbi:MAG TPA: hypothetical protein VLU43_04365 [Anaeromyxobacteraceae bacterium]|nr:hypothetical protein [Anaeromyxobacteraceae bacterium]